MPPSCARLLPVSMRLFGAASGASLRRDVGAVGAVVLCGGASTLPGAFVQRGPSPGVSPIEGVATNVLDRAPLSPAFASRAASTAAAIKGEAGARAEAVDGLHATVLFLYVLVVMTMGLRCRSRPFKTPQTGWRS